MDTHGMLPSCCTIYRVRTPGGIQSQNCRSFYKKGQSDLTTTTCPVYSTLLYKINKLKNNRHCFSADSMGRRLCKKQFSSKILHLAIKLTYIRHLGFWYSTNSGACLLSMELSADLCVASISTTAASAAVSNPRWRIYVNF